MMKGNDSNNNKLLSNPVNEVNRHYPMELNENGQLNDLRDIELDNQYMVKDGQPVNQRDTEFLNSYRITVDELRTKTESYCEELESCILPTPVKGMAFQPRKNYPNGDFEKLNTYVFQDHECIISKDRKEYVFRTNKVRFVNDQHRRCIYDRTIHFMSTKEDEEAGTTFYNLIRHKMGFTYYNSAVDGCAPRMKDISYANITDAQIRKNVFGVDPETNLMYNPNLQFKTSTGSVTVKYEGLNYQVFDQRGNLVNTYPRSETGVTALVTYVNNLTLISGQVINTLVPSTVFNLYKLGWIHPALFFLDGYSMSWVNTIISVDSIDTFVIFSPLPLTSLYINCIDDEKELTMEYIHLPFNVFYIPYNIVPKTSYEYTRFAPEGASELISDPMFMIDNKRGSMVMEGDSGYSSRKTSNSMSSTNIDRIMCLDPDIIFTNISLSRDTESTGLISKLGLTFNYSGNLSEFCEHDYRYKLKQFNFLGFEWNRSYYLNNPDKYITPNRLKNDDFTITWHPFNIMDIKFDKLDNGSRRFMVYYNKKVVYDQDNILRLKNIGQLEEDYEIYRKDLTANVATYIKEIHNLARKDIGMYVDKTTDMKYVYVSPYEIFDLYYKVTNKVITISVFSMFAPNLLRGGFIPYGTWRVFEEERTKHGRLLGDVNNDGVAVGSSDDISEMYRLYYTNTSINQPIQVKECFDLNDDRTGIITNNDPQLLIKTISSAIIGSIIPIDPEVYITEGVEDNLGKIVPISSSNLVPLNDPTEYDKLKFRFEFVTFDSIDEGATPVDEFIYYLSDKSDSSSVTAKKYLDELATQIFKYDPGNVKEIILQMNKQSNRYIPTDIAAADRDNYYTKDISANKIYNRLSRVADRVIKDEWMLRQGLPEMFDYHLDSNRYAISDMKLLDEVFDFTYDDSKSYQENLSDGADYILGYDADKLENSIKHNVVSISRTYRELYEAAAFNRRNRKGFNISYIPNNEPKCVIFHTYNDYKVQFHTPVELSEMELDTIEIPFRGTLYYKDGNGSNVAAIRITVDEVIDIDRNRHVPYSTTVLNTDQGIVEYYNSSNVKVASLYIDSLSIYHGINMSRWNVGYQEASANNYIMAFVNGKIMDEYSDILYNDNMFHLDLRDNYSDDDVFEFVFFLNVNNTIISKTSVNDGDMSVTVPNMMVSIHEGTLDEQITLDKAISCNTSIIAPENLRTFVNVMPTDPDIKYHPNRGSYTNYPINHSIRSYRELMHESSVTANRRYFKYSLEADYMVNGQYRVTKHGGGEYFITFTGATPDFPNSTLTTPYTIYAVSKRQFRYMKHMVQNNYTSAGYSFMLGEEFRFCYDENHLMVFRNGLLIPQNSVFAHSIVDTPVNELSITLDIPVNRGDKIEVFYTTNTLTPVKSSLSIVNGSTIKNTNNQTIRIMGDPILPGSAYNYSYIRFRSPFYGYASSETTFIFLNGKKVPTSYITDVSGTILSINTYDLKGYTADNLVVFRHLDSMDLVTKMYLNDGLNHYLTNAMANHEDVPEEYYKMTNGGNILGIDLTQLPNYSSKPKLDEMLNNLTDVQLNRLFYYYSTGGGPDARSDTNDIANKNFVSRDSLLEILLSKYPTIDQSWIEKFR